MDQSPDDANRLEESRQIEERFAGELAKRGPVTKSFSPDYLATLPKSAIEALGVTPQEQEEILFHYACTSSIPKTASLARVGSDKVRAVIFTPSASETLRVMRERMSVSIIDKIKDTQISLLEAMQNETKLQNAPLREISSVFSEITSSQIALMTASTDSALPPELQADPSDIFSGDELEYMAYMRRKMSAGPRNSRPSGDSVDHSEFAGHDLVDSEFEVSNETIDPGYEPVPEVIDRSYDAFANDSSD